MTSEEKRKKVIEVALSQIGISESPANSNNVKYNTWIYGHEVHDGDKPGAHYPWCGAFVSWVFDQSGLPLGRIDLMKGFVGCPFAVEHVEKWGVIVKDPLPGDVVFYAWKGYNGFKSIQHVGIFEKYNSDDKKHLTSIEGNTSVKDNSNGGCVMYRSDRPYSLVAVFVRPNVLINNL